VVPLIVTCLGWSFFDPDRKHFKASQKAYNKAVKIINDAEGVLVIDSQNRLMDALQLALDEAREVKPEFLREHHPRFEYYFKNRYIKGLDLWITGMKKVDAPAALRGQEYIREYIEWFEKAEIRV